MGVALKTGTETQPLAAQRGGIRSRHWRWYLGFAIVASIAIGSAPTACGEDPRSGISAPQATDAAELTVENYGIALQRLHAELSRTIDSIAQPYGTVGDSDAVNREFYGLFETALRDYANGVSELSAPKPMSELNARLMRRVRVALDQVALVKAMIGHEQDQTEEQALAGLKKFDDSFLAVQASCREIQDSLSHAAGETVDLGCDALFGSRFHAAP
jgi:hypothetical protein